LFGLLVICKLATSSLGGVFSWLFYTMHCIKQYAVATLWPTTKKKSKIKNTLAN
jgi:hypothetical protein